MNRNYTSNSLGEDVDRRYEIPMGNLSKEEELHFQNRVENNTFRLSFFFLNLFFLSVMENNHFY